MPALRPHHRLAVPVATTLALVLASPCAAGAAWAVEDDKGRGHGKGEKGSASQDEGSKGSRGSQGDPAGNNGTIKVDGVPLDDGRGNEPHVPCAFAVDFYGFDTGSTADITFTGMAPTGGGTLLSHKGVTISDDAAGGGQDRDATLVHTAEQLGLTGTAPHRNGWHVKVSVDVLEAPGGSKSKVFWIDCDSAAADDTEERPTGKNPGTTTPGITSPGTTAPVTTIDGAVGGTTDRATGGRATASTGVAGVFEEAPTSVGTVSSNAVSPASPVSTGSGPLAATGGELAAMVLLGLSALGVGTAGVLAGRRSREASLA